MSTKKVGTKHAISRFIAVMLLIAIISLAVIVSVLVLNYDRNTELTPGTANSELNPSPTLGTANLELNSSQLGVTIDYSVFQPIANFGNGTWQFEENNLHVYNYTYDGTMATFNITVDDSIIVSPTLYDGLLLVDLSTSAAAENSGGVAAINMQNGQMVWRTIFPNMVMTQPITYEGLVIVGLGNNNQPRNSTSPGEPNCVAALNFSTGNVVWTFVTNGEDMPTPLIYDGLVIGVNGNGVYALNATSGQVWNGRLPGLGSSMSSPALLGNSIFFGAGDAFRCVNLTDGQVSWSTLTPQTGGLTDCSPTIWNDIVISGYTVATSGGLYVTVLFAMNTTNGNILWQLNETAGAPPEGYNCASIIEVPPITVWNGIVYSDSTESGTLYAVNASSGVLLWSFNTGGDNCNANIFDGNLWMVNNNGILFVLNPVTGVLLETTNVGAGVGPGNLVFAGQNVIISELSGQVISMPASHIYPG